MAGSREKTIVILGPAGAGKSTVTGCMLFKFGGIDMLTMERLERSGVGSSGQKYAATAKDLRQHGNALQFFAPNQCHVTILDSGVANVDCAILVLPANAPESFVVDRRKDYGAAKKVVIIVNKMDIISWSEERFLQAVTEIGLWAKDVPVIPISATTSSNVVEFFSHGWKHGPQTLLQALNVALQD